MKQAKPVNVTVVYRVKPGKEHDFMKILKKHGPALKSSGLISDEPVRTYRAHNHREEKQSVFIETMQWKDENSSDIAHQTPEIMAVWEPMGPLLEKLEIFNTEPLNI